MTVYFLSLHLFLPDVVFFIFFCDQNVATIWLQIMAFDFT